MKWSFIPRIKTMGDHTLFTFYIGNRQISTDEALIFIDEYCEKISEPWGFLKRGGKLTIFNPPNHPVDAIDTNDSIAFLHLQVLFSWVPKTLGFRFIENAGSIIIETPESVITLREFLSTLNKSSGYNRCIS